jgi:hypothetical protein
VVAPTASTESGAPDGSIVRSPPAGLAILESGDLNGGHTIGGGAITELPLVIPTHGPQGAIGLDDQRVFLTASQLLRAGRGGVQNTDYKTSNSAAATHLRPGTIRTSLK